MYKVRKQTVVLEYRYRAGAKSSIFLEGQLFPTTTTNLTLDYFPLPFSRN